MRLAALVLALAGSAALPAAASAYAVGGNRWPGKTIRYYVAARGYATAVDTAARNWNRAGVGMRFAASGRASADVVVAYGAARCGGVSPMGYGRPQDATVVRLGAGCSTQFIVLTATHELGHVLGLDHESGHCARMNPSFSPEGTPTRCARHPLSYWLAHPLTADDVAGAKAIYRSGAQPDGTGDPYQHDPYDHGWRDWSGRWG
jgi:predicted Zn-dependent protease